MTLTLYHYVHCPYCVRVRMALGYLQLPYLSKVLPYNDEETPLKLTGKKMLPILAHPKGVINESLDIIALLDKENLLKAKHTMDSHDFKDFDQLLIQLGNPIHSLAMPYWIYTPEFSPETRTYFQAKKEEKRGPFKDLVKNRKKFEAELSTYFRNIETDLSPYYKSSQFGLKDILLAAHLWGLYVVPEFQFPVIIHNYLQSVKELCHFDYHQDFWN